MPCYRICKISNNTYDNNFRELRKIWENWDLRILILYILIAQLYLLFCGRLRRKSKSPLMTIVSVWLLYLFSDLLATIALGKLSKVKVDEKEKDHVLRVLWAPLLLFYLGGPDTLTVLRVEENKLWVRHLIGLITQGLRAAYVLLVTWSAEDFSLLAVLMFLPGIIKYGERVWVVRLRSQDNYEGFVKIDLDKIKQISDSRPNAKLVLLAYSWFQTLMPHNPGYECDGKTVRDLVTDFHESVRARTVDAFKLIEIELGLIYDMLFSKVGTLFTVLGSILRFLSFSLVVAVLVIFSTRQMPQGYLVGDHVITIILIGGAIFLEIAGLFVQLVSDWAMVWACKYSSKWATSVLFLHEFLISKSQRWSGVMGQFSYQDFCTNYKPTFCNDTWEYLFTREKMLKRFSSQGSPSQHLKDLIISQLREKSEKGGAVDTVQTSTQNIAVADTSQTSTKEIADVNTAQTSTENVKLPTVGVERGGWTLLKYNLVEQYNWSIELDFSKSIVIWHVATQVLYNSDHSKIVGKDEKLEAVKILSDYMMYLLVVCHSRFFPFCNAYYEITQDDTAMREVFEGVLISSNPKGGVEKVTLADKARRLVQELNRNPKKWEFMGSIWVEMLCFAAKKCPVKNHMQELRHGGEFLTHIWLMLMHFGVTKKLERSNSSLKDEHDSGLKTTVGPLGEIQQDKFEKMQQLNADEKRKQEGGIEAASEADLVQNSDLGWNVSSLE